MIRRFVIEWEACKPIGERAVIVNTFAGCKRNRVEQVLGYVWPKGRRFYAAGTDGKILGPLRLQAHARRRVVQGQVMNGQPVLVRSKG